MAERPNLRRHAAAIRERVVARHGAVLVQAQDLAEIGVHVLRRIELLPISRAEPEITATERDSMTVMTAAVHLRRLPPNHLEVLQLAAIAIERELGSSDGGAARFALAGFRVAQIDETVTGVIGMQHDVAETALAEPADLGHAANIDLRAPWRIQLQCTALLRNEQPPVGKKSHGPRNVEVGDLRHRERQVLGDCRRDRPSANGSSRQREQVDAS